MAMGDEPSGSSAAGDAMNRKQRREARFGVKRGGGSEDPQLKTNAAGADEEDGTKGAKASKQQQKKAKKMTIWEKYEQHRQHVQETEQIDEQMQAEAEDGVNEAVDAEADGGIRDPGPTGHGGELQEEHKEDRVEGVRGAVVAGWEAGKEAASQQKAKKIPVLPWMRVPVTIDGGHGVHLEEVRGLDGRLTEALHGEGMVELFPVQAAVWQLTAGGHSHLHDVCICAPTGSGKTLAYALPMVQALSRHSTRKLRGLVVVPTRDLAMQVFEVLRGLSEAAGLCCGLVAGRDIEKVEAAALVQAAGRSRVDMAVATPGRLMSHLKKTTGFSLDDLEILVVDEADRLLRQSYNEWLPQVMGLLKHSTRRMQAAGRRIRSPDDGVLKLIVSATLTQDPSKIDRLDLYCPRYVAVSSKDYRYKLPRELKEQKVMCDGGDKPLVLVALLNELSDRQTVVFTSSVEATHRLWVMLKCFTGLHERPLEFSSHISEVQRQANLDMFRTGAAKIMVASDAMTRGMDVPGVTVVINYDTPVYAKTYVHRAGRTARAGRDGQVYTLLRREDMKHFKAMLRKADNTFVSDFSVAAEAVEELRPQLPGALEGVAAWLRDEAVGGKGGRPGGEASAMEEGPIAAIIRMQAERNIMRSRAVAAKAT